MKCSSIQYRYIKCLSMLMIVCMFVSACVDQSQFEDVSSENTQEIAIPIINTEVSIVDYAANASENAVVKIDPDGKMTVFYEGEVIRKSAIELFPPVPGKLVGDGIIEDTVSTLGLTFDEEFLLKKAVFKSSTIRFKFRSTFEEDLTINLTIPEWSKDGEVFSMDYVLPYNGVSPDSLVTDVIELDGWVVETETNDMTFNYDARLPNGERVKLDLVTYELDFILFSYVEGFFTQNTNSESGDIITVGVYSNWVSGGLYFEDPKVTFQVRNSFGFPVRAYFNKMELTNVLDEVYNMEGEFIDNGVDFSYPALDEVGELKQNFFEFNKTNSNLQEIFNEKVKLVRYDIDAVGNPENDNTIIGFLTDTSYYVVDIAVELPLLGYANDLILVDTFDFDLADIDVADEIEFKLITENRFPIEMKVQGIFLDENKAVLDSLFFDQALNLDAASEISPGLLQTTGEKVNYLNFEKDRLDNIRRTRSMAFRVFMTSTEQNNESIWIYDSYGMDVRMGAKIKLN